MATPSQHGAIDHSGAGGPASAALALLALLIVAFGSAEAYGGDRLYVPPVHGMTAFSLVSLLPVWLAVGALAAAIMVNRVGAAVAQQTGLIVFGSGAAIAAAAVHLSRDNLDSEIAWNILRPAFPPIMAVGAMLVMVGALVTAYRWSVGTAGPAVLGVGIGITLVAPATKLLIDWESPLRGTFMLLAGGAVLLAALIRSQGHRQWILLAALVATLASGTAGVAWIHGTRNDTFRSVQQEVAFFVLAFLLVVAAAATLDRRFGGKMLPQLSRDWPALAAIGVSVVLSGAAFRAIQFKVLADLETAPKLGILAVVLLVAVGVAVFATRLDRLDVFRWVVGGLLVFAVIRRIGGPGGLAVSLAVFAGIFALYLVVLLRSVRPEMHGYVVGGALFAQLAVPVLWLEVTWAEAPVGRTPIIVLSVLLAAVVYYDTTRRVRPHLMPFESVD